MASFFRSTFLPAAKPAGQWIIIGVLLLPAIFSELGFLVGFLKVRFLTFKFLIVKFLKVDFLKVRFLKVGFLKVGFLKV